MEDSRGTRACLVSWSPHARLLGLFGAVNTYAGYGYGCNSGLAWFRLYPHRLRRRGLLNDGSVYGPEETY